MPDITRVTIAVVVDGEERIANFSTPAKLGALLDDPGVGNFIMDVAEQGHPPVRLDVATENPRNVEVDHRQGDAIADELRAVLPGIFARATGRADISAPELVAAFLGLAIGAAREVAMPEDFILELVREILDAKLRLKGSVDA